MFPEQDDRGLSRSLLPISERDVASCLLESEMLNVFAPLASSQPSGLITRV